MRRTLALSTIVMAAVGTFIFLAPVVYSPAVPPDCNFFCASAGSPANYRSISAQLFGQGATYWVVSPSVTYYCISLWVVSSNCPYA